MNYEQARFNMIEQQIRPWEVLDQNVLQLLAVVKREDFVPLAQRALAFVDMEIPLPGGQCMLAPKVEARILQELAVQKHEKVLEIGAGSGYMAALLAHRAQQVITLEIQPELVRMARENLARAGIHNAEVREADGAAGLSGGATNPVLAQGPFDVIVLSGSVAEVPSALLAALKVGGRLAAIVGDEPVMRATFVTRTSEAGYRTTQPWDTLAPRLLNFSEPSRFHF
jgi:protein-L-isoaspartate(D-aspartate) O-methyltransferase